MPQLPNQLAVLTLSPRSATSPNPVPSSTTTTTEASSNGNNKLAMMQAVKAKNMLGEKFQAEEQKIALILRGAVPEGVEALSLGGGVNSLNGSSTFASTTGVSSEAARLGISGAANANAVRAALIGQYMLGSDFTAAKGKRGSSGKKESTPTTVAVSTHVPGPKVDPKTTKAWLKIEVAKSIRRMRSDFFVLTLSSVKNLTGETLELQNHFEGVFDDYIGGEAGDKEVSHHARVGFESRHTHKFFV